MTDRDTPALDIEEPKPVGDWKRASLPRTATPVPAVEHHHADMARRQEFYAGLQNDPARRAQSSLDIASAVFAGHTDTGAHQRYVGATPQRWNIEMNGDDQIIEKAPDGEWMRAEDVLPLLARLGDRDQLRDGLGRIAQQLTAAEAQVERLTALLLEAKDALKRRGEPGGQ